MFTYWKGYEIDGSSTTYNIVIPQQELIVEVLRYIMSLKIIDRNENINISYSETSDKLWKKEVIKNDIYKFEESEKILRAENKVYNYKKPTISPFYYAESFDIWIGVSFYDQEKTVEDYEPEGLIFNEKALVANMNNL
jgi:hypothetical protein